MSSRGIAGLFEQLPYGLALADHRGRLLELNRRGLELLSVSAAEVEAQAATCCEHICERAASELDGNCLARLTLDRREPVPEVRIDLGGDRVPTAAWVATSPVHAAEARVLFHLRPAAASDRRRRAALDLSTLPAIRICALGGFKVIGPDGPIDEARLGQRSGQLLKYLVCERSRVVASEQVAEALWPGAGQREALGSVRHYVHQLRRILEPDRSARDPSTCVVTRRGGYALEGVWIDVDEFEHRVATGVAALARGNVELARERLEQGRELYRGDFLVNDRYLEWALAERERLRELAGRMLRALVEIERGAHNVEQAIVHARELSEMEPFDLDVQRTFLTLCLDAGRRTEALRRYDILRNRMRHAFGQDPGFGLADLTG